MNLWQRLGLAYKAVTRPESYVWTLSDAKWTQWDFNAYASEGYQQNPYVFRAINLLTQSCAGVQVYPYIQAGDGELVEMPGDEVTNLLTRPNDLQGWPDLLESLLGFYLLGGQTFLRGIGPSPNAPPVELYAFGPDVMAVKPGPAVGTIEAFKYKAKSGEVLVPKEEVFWFHSWNPLDPWDGMPAIKPCSRAIDANSAALAYNKAVLDNGGFPATVLTSDSTIPQTQKDLWATQWRARMGGASKAGGVAIFDGGLKPYKLGLTPTEMSWDKLITMTSRQVGLVFGIPPEMLGDASQKTYSNYREARASFYQDTVLPLLDKFYAGFSRWLSTKYGKPIVLGYDVDDIEALSFYRAEKWTSLRESWDSGILTLNETLEGMGYPTADGPEGEERKKAAAPANPFGQPPASTGKPKPGMDMGEDNKPEPDEDDMVDVEDGGKAWRINIKRKSKHRRCGCE